MNNTTYNNEKSFLLGAENILYKVKKKRSDEYQRFIQTS